MSERGPGASAFVPFAVCLLISSLVFAPVVGCGIWPVSLAILVVGLWVANAIDSSGR